MKDDDRNDAVSVGIIGSADGPTSIIVNENRGKVSLRVRIRNFIYRCRRKAAEKRIPAAAHTREELIAYAKRSYGAVEVESASAGFLPDSCIYEIRIGSDSLTLEIDDERDTLGVSYSGSKNTAKRFRKMMKDLYLYYGVAEEDIQQMSERYLSLLGVLSL